MTRLRLAEFVAALHALDTTHYVGLADVSEVAP